VFISAVIQWITVLQLQVAMHPLWSLTTDATILFLKIPVVCRPCQQQVMPLMAKSIMNPSKEKDSEETELPLFFEFSL